MIPEPFPHAVIDDFAPPELCRAAVAEWPRPDWPHWFLYEGERGRKRVSHDAGRLGPASQELVRQMARLPVSSVLQLFGTFPDLTLYGAGMSEIDGGGDLPKHLDGDHNPITGWERAASAMLYLSHCGGGRLQLWDAAGEKIVTEIDPEPGRLVLFECGDAAWHSVEKVCEGRRLSLSLFFWRLPGGGTQRRPRAEFKGTDCDRRG